VEAFRSGAHDPVAEVEATLAAIDASPLGAFSFLDPDGALRSARQADRLAPFGGVPVGIKELQSVAGWPDTEACVALRDRRAERDTTLVARTRASGAIPVGLTTASEFGGVNLTRTVLNGTTHNPWQHGRTPGGSSGGSAAAVAGGLVTLATAGDGGGSTRIPAGFCGLVGLKGTYGRIPRGPSAEWGNMTAVSGAVTRSVRDSARFFDVTNGFDPHDPFSLERVQGYEVGLGSHLAGLRGRRVCVAWDFGGARVASASVALLAARADALIDALGLERVDVSVTLPNMGTAWSLSGMLGIRAALGDRWPDCAKDLTPEIRFGLEWSDGRWNAEAAMKVAERRTKCNDAMAALFGTTDLVITATNPDVAFGADGPLPSVFDGVEVGAWNNGRLTAPSNLYGNPAISIPAGTVDGLPVGLQVLAPHFREDWLLDVAFVAEQLAPWPLVAPQG
jgi:aspartyl-tRNA(Asn)/glutamyl-tRNA(Gln) amidotransferase subunit A